MATISPFSVITADGSYEIETRSGHEHLLTLRDDFGGGTVVMTGKNNADGSYTSISGGSWTAESEIRFYPASDSIRLTVTGSTGANILVNLLPIYKR